MVACFLEQWRLWSGETGTAPATAAMLRNAPVDSGNWNHLGARFCALIIETIHAALTGADGTDSLLARLDSATVTVPVPGNDPAAWFLVPVANRVISRILEDRGRADDALRVTRRQSYFAGASLLFLASRLRDMARLAETAGDRVAAIDALGRYIDMRSESEPSMMPDLERARADLARLVGEPRND